MCNMLASARPTGVREVSEQQTNEPIKRTLAIQIAEINGARAEDKGCWAVELCIDAPSVDDKSGDYVPIAPDGHKFLRMKPKAKDSLASYWIIPDPLAQVAIVCDRPEVLAMFADLYEQQCKLWMKEFNEGNANAADWIADVNAGAARYFVNGRTLGVKQAEIEEWINGAFKAYMTERISKNAGFTDEQKVALVAALVKKYLTASTKSNEMKVGKELCVVSRDELASLQKRLEGYLADESNKLAECNESKALLRKIIAHQQVVVKEMDVTNADF